MVHDLIKKLIEKHSCFEFSIKNNMQKDEVQSTKGKLKKINYEMTMQLIILKETDQGMTVQSKVEGYGCGNTRREAVDNAKIDAMNTIGIF